MIDNRTKYGIDIHQENDGGRTALQMVNERIEEVSEEEEASFKELKRILEKAYLEDNDPQPSVKKLRTQ